MRKGIPKRCPRGELLPTFRVESPEQAADRFLSLLAEHRARWGEARLYLFVSPEREAYVISDDRPAATEWIARKADNRFHWLVARYDSPEKPPSLPATREGLIEDITCHLEDLRQWLASH